MENSAKKTAIPIIGGTLAIAAGGLKLLAFLGLLLYSFFAIAPQGNFRFNIGIISLLFGMILVILGILSIVGGLYALQRKHFGLAVTGAITAFLPFSLMGLASIILLSLSRNEFE